MRTWLYLYTTNTHIYTYGYMSWGPGFTAHPRPHGLGAHFQLSQGVEYACHGCICMHMHAYAFTCINICICISTSTYVCIAYACKHIRAWHACIFICMHGMNGYMHASCHVHLHTHTHRGGDPHMGGALLQYILWASPLSTPHPTGGGSITITTPSPLAGGRR